MVSMLDGAQRLLRKGSESLRDASVFGGGAAGAEAAASEAAASDALLEGLKRFLEDAAARSGTGAGQLKGFLFERIEAARINTDAVRKGLDVRAHLTADSPGGGTDPRVDIQIISNGRVVEEIQSKASDDPSWLARTLSQSKYDGTTGHVPRGLEATVNEKMTDSSRVTGKLEQSGASSGGTTMGELQRATKNPPFFALGQGGMQIAREAAVTGAYAGAAGAVFGGALSSIQNTYALARGELGRHDAVKNVKSDTVRSGLRSGVAGAIGTVIRHGAGKAGMMTLHKANVANAVATGAIETGDIVQQYARGKIPADVAAERIGQTGCTTLSGIYFGAWTGAMFGPVGAVAGSVAGYLIAATVYQCCVQEIREGDLSREGVERVAALGHEAARVLGLQRGEIESALANVPRDLKAALAGQIAAVDLTLISERPTDTYQALGNFVKLVGERLAK